MGKSYRIDEEFFQELKKIENIGINRETYTFVFGFIKEHKETYRLHFILNRKEKTENYLQQEIRKEINRHVSDKYTAEYLLTYFVIGANGIMKKWIEEGCVVSIETMVDIILECYPL